ncbi:hypothetical protein CEXT_334481 [Caerostris extrusa]|uniref:Uncharacterized protein n=1 Tax=Caerostris extrusa TaxID=172846 RepID=A0AAV4WX44_CAEEX|nr:hypothetical protein CEXT_334481 [Caerostris extrusa]
MSGRCSFCFSSNKVHLKGIEFLLKVYVEHVTSKRTSKLVINDSKTVSLIWRLSPGQPKNIMSDQTGEAIACEY